MPVSPSLPDSPIVYTVRPETQYINALVYGRPGVGKTMLACSAQDHPKLRDVLVINTEAGLLSVASRGDIRAVNVQTVQEVEAVFWALRQRRPGFETIRTVVIDSGSELQSLSLRNIVAREVTTARGNKRTLDDIWLEDYGTSTNELSRVFQMFRDLDVHFVVTALLKHTYPGGKGNLDPTEAGPRLTTKLAEQLMGYVDFVWYMYADDSGERHILTEDRGIYRAKTRGPAFRAALTERYSNPSLPDIYELLLTTEAVRGTIGAADQSADQ